MISASLRTCSITSSFGRSSILHAGDSGWANSRTRTPARTVRDRGKAVNTSPPPMPLCRLI